MANLTFFSADNGVSGTELWVTDGTAAGTYMLKEIRPGASGSTPSNFVRFGDKVFFQADGSTTYPNVFGLELWATDGTAAGTVMVKDIYPANNGSYPANFAVLGDKLVFEGYALGTGKELFVTDGTTAGTKLLMDINPGDGSSIYTPLTRVGDKLLFGAAVPGYGIDPWITDGTVAGTVRVADLARYDSPYPLSGIVSLGDRALFAGGAEGTGLELIVSDGTESGTVLIDIRPGWNAPSDPKGFVRAGDLAYFQANDGVVGTELWVSDGTAGGTRLVKDIRSDGASSPTNLTAFGDKLLFTATTTGAGSELWISDGTANGTILLRDIEPGAAGSSIGQIGVLGDKAVFTAQTSAEGAELWITDGTPAGTFLLKDIVTGAGSSSPTGFTVIGDKLLFSAQDGVNGVELWITDGTAAGTTLVKDIRAGGNSSPQAFFTTEMDLAPNKAVNGGATVLEGGSIVLDGALLKYHDADTADADLHYTITTLPARGELRFDGVALAFSGGFSQADVDSGRLTYVHDGSEAASASFGFEVTDGSGQKLANQSFAITVTPVNDSPTRATNTGLTALEGSTWTIDASMLDYDDAEQADSAIVYTLASVSANLTVRRDGGALSIGSTFTQADVNNHRISFVHDGGETTSASFGFSVSDGQGGVLAGQSFAITVNPINDKPTVQDSTITLPEDGWHTLSLADFGFADIEGNSFYQLWITTFPTGGQFFFVGDTETTPIPHYQVGAGHIEQGRIRYVPAADGSGTGYDSFEFQVMDSGWAVSAIHKITFDVTPADDPMTEGANAGLTLAEGASAPITAAILDFNDADQPDTGIVYTVTSLATNGVLQMNGATIGSGDTFTQQDVADGLVTFVHDGSETTSASFGFSVSDGQGSQLTGRTFAITVTPVDDPTAASADTATVAEHATVVIDVFANDDPDGGTTELVAYIERDAVGVGQSVTLASGAIVTLNADGTLTYDPNGKFDSAAAGSGGVTQAYDGFRYQLSGGTSANVSVTITGIDNDDLFFATEGDDAFDGGIGVNTVSYANVANGGVHANIGITAPNDTIGAGTDTLANFQNLTGSDFVDELRGGMGNNVLDGGTGADVMLGWWGDDSYIVDDAGDSIREAAGQGTDTVRTSVSYTLPDREIENLVLTGTADLNATGNQYANTLTGNIGVNWLCGAGGDDRIDGGAGADVMAGGLGDDTYVVDDLGDRVKERDGQGTDTVESWINWSLPGLEVENLKLMGDAIEGSGNHLANVITGNALANGLAGYGGDDRIDGGKGADLMAGGVGDDTYVVDNVGDRIREHAGEGIDTVESEIAFSLAGLEVENLTLTGKGEIDGTGNGYANVLTGNISANALLGYDGNDTLSGGDGDDSLHGMAGKDVMTGGEGADRFYFDVAPDAATNIDTITDFEAGIDSIHIRRAVFGGVAGPLAADAFVIGDHALDAGDRVIYDSATGALYFDSDGSGATAAVQFAALDPGLSLTNLDFTLF